MGKKNPARLLETEQENISSKGYSQTIPIKYVPK